jgi:hypothetical protein
VRAATPATSVPFSIHRSPIVLKNVLLVALQSCAFAAYAGNDVKADTPLPSQLLQSEGAVGELTFKVSGPDKTSLDCAGSVAAKNNMAVNVTSDGPSATVTWEPGKAPRRQSTPAQFSVTGAQPFVGNGAYLDAIVKSLLSCRAGNGTTLTWSASLRH